MAEIRLSARDKFRGDQAEQVPSALGSQGQLAFEVIACSGQVRLQLAGTSEDIPAAARQISAYYPTTEVFPSTDRVKEVIDLIRDARSYCLKESFLFQIKTGHTVDPFISLLGEMNGLGPGECLLFQMLFIPVRADWTGNILSVARDHWDPSRNPFIDLPQLPRGLPRARRPCLYSR